MKPTNNQKNINRKIKYVAEELGGRNCEVIYFAETLKNRKSNVFPFGEDKRWGPRLRE